jgi:hypothetical protein
MKTQFQKLNTFFKSKPKGIEYTWGKMFLWFLIFLIFVGLMGLVGALD